MPTFRITSPDGRTFNVTGPDGSTAEQALARVQAMQAMQVPQAIDPTEGMSTTDKVLAGIGKGMTDLARGAGQWVGAVSREEVAEARKLDAPLMNTKAGAFGNFIGKAVPLAASSVLVPGAASLAGAGGIGAAAGALEPSESTGETLTNIGVGGAAGAVGQRVGNSIADWLSKRAASKTAAFVGGQAANAQKLGVARDASKAGYVIPPSDVRPQNAIVEALGGLSGKIKTAQVASSKNQAVTDALVKKAIGLPPDAPITVDSLAAIRQQAGQAYQAVASAGTITPGTTYAQALDDAVKPFVSQAKSFPGRKIPAVVEDVQAMKTAAFDAGDAVEAIKVLRNDADAAYRAGDKLAGAAYKKASEAVEQAIDDHLVASGAPADLLSGYREARKLIAKTYTVQKAANPQTGEVSAQALARELAKGRPLSGELKQVAEIGQAFPKATQALKEAPKTLSPLDFGAAGIGLAGSGGNPLATLGLVARPAARAALLSPQMQRNAMRDTAPPSFMLTNAASNPLMRLLYGPMGAAAAVNSGQ